MTLCKHRLPSPADEHHFIACPVLSNEQFWQLFFQPCTQPHMWDGITHSADEQHFITCPALLREMVDCVFKVSIKWTILTIAHPALHWIPYSASSLILILRSSLWFALCFISPIFKVCLFLTFLQFLQLCPHIVPAGGVEEGAEAVGGSEAVGSRRRRVAWPEAATHSREEVSPQRWGGGRILQVLIGRPKRGQL